MGPEWVAILTLVALLTVTGVLTRIGAQLGRPRPARLVSN